MLDKNTMANANVLIFVRTENIARLKDYINSIIEIFL